MSEVREVAENVYLIDAEVGSMPKLNAVYLINEDKKALIDSGSSNSATTILEGIKQLGVDPEEVSYIIVTHMHLDHAGGAGILIKEMPYAKILVHPRGVKHLINPNKLMASNMQVMGQEGLAIYGVMASIEPEKVEAVEDNVVIELGPQQRLKVIYTPGHANHHLCAYEERNKGLFAGDAIGMYFAEAEFLFPEVTPYDFNLKLAFESIEKVEQLPLEILYFAHFGTSEKTDEMLQVARDRLKFWSDLIYQVRNDSLRNICEKVKETIFGPIWNQPELVQQYMASYSFHIQKLLPVSVAGYLDYFKRVSEGKVG